MPNTVNDAKHAILEEKREVAAFAASQTKSFQNFHTGNYSESDFYGDHLKHFVLASNSGGWHVGDNQDPTPGVNVTEADASMRLVNGQYQVDNRPGSATFDLVNGVHGSFELVGGSGVDGQPIPIFPTTGNLHYVNFFNVDGGDNINLKGGEEINMYSFGADFNGKAQIESYHNDSSDTLSLSGHWHLETANETAGNGHPGDYAWFSNGTGGEVEVMGVSRQNMAYTMLQDHIVDGGDLIRISGIIPDPKTQTSAPAHVQTSPLNSALGNQALHVVLQPVATVHTITPDASRDIVHDTLLQHANYSFHFLG